MCLADPYWTFLATTREICSPAERQRGETVYGGPSAQLPKNAIHTIYRGPAFILAVLPAQ